MKHTQEDSVPFGLAIMFGSDTGCVEEDQRNNGPIEWLRFYDYSHLNSRITLITGYFERNKMFIVNSDSKTSFDWLPRVPNFLAHPCRATSIALICKKQDFNASS